MKTTLLLLALLCAAAAHAEQVYKWTDAAGIVHYSDAPPPKDTQNVQTVRVTGGDRPHAVPIAENNTESGENKKPDAGGAAPPTQPGSKSDDVRSKNCQTARANLEILQSNYPVAMGGGDGKALDDSGRQSQIAEANAQIAFYCR